MKLFWVLWIRVTVYFRFNTHGLFKEFTSLLLDSWYSTYSDSRLLEWKSTVDSHCECKINTEKKIQSLRRIYKYLKTLTSRLFKFNTTIINLAVQFIRFLLLFYYYLVHISWIKIKRQFLSNVSQRCFVKCKFQ